MTTPAEMPKLAHDPAALTAVTNAYSVYLAARQESVAEQQEAVERIAASHAEHIARCASEFHYAAAEAYAVGFSPEQVEAQLQYSGLLDEGGQFL